MGSDVVFDSPYLDRYLRFGWYLDIIMLLLQGDSLLMFGFDSTVDLDYQDCTFDNGWFHVTWFPIYHTSMPYWGIFHFGWDLRIFMELHDHLSLRDTHRDEDLFVILLWSSNGALLESFILTRTFRHLDVIMFLLLSYEMHVGLMTRLHFAMII